MKHISDENTQSAFTSSKSLLGTHEHKHKMILSVYYTRDVRYFSQIQQ